jgi:hypothetical protein
MISEWLDKNGDPKIYIQVLEEALELQLKQQSMMFSQEEVILFLQQYRYDLSSNKTANLGDTTKQWFEQYLKNKI